MTPDGTTSPADAPTTVLVRRLEDLGSGDVAEVGGKNASLGEMISTLAGEGVQVPGGFATTATAYRRFLEEAGLEPQLREQLDRYERDADALPEVGRAIREAIEAAELPEDLAEAIRGAYRELAERRGEEDPPVAVRSSATAEDLPEASFAGQQETFLHVRGAADLLEACRRCYASLFTDRAISYRATRDFDHLDVALSVGVQAMVEASEACSGVLFTLDPESGFRGVIVIDATWGLGETVVGGEVEPDAFVVFAPGLEREGTVPILQRRRGAKRIKAVRSSSGPDPIERVDTSEDERGRLCLRDEEVLRLARWGAAIERHYGRPMDVEWAKDAGSGELFIVQARPETVQSRREGGLRTYALRERSEALVTGLAVGDAIATGRVRVLRDPSEGGDFEDGDVLVAPVTDPDWGPIMGRAAAVVTDHGGRTAHAAIVSRELGIPAIVGCGDATERLEDGAMVTVSCAEGPEGTVWAGELEVETDEIDLDDLPETRTSILMNLASPDAAFRWHRLPARGVGLARMEFIVMNAIGVHPMALVRPDAVEDAEERRRIAERVGDEDPEEFFVRTLAEGVARIAAARHPDRVLLRTSDFKTNEYAQLLGGAAFEPKEENPMIGVRGASRYTRELYRDGFALECRAIRRVRETIGLDNLMVMIPFCRTPEEADAVLAVLEEEGLERGRDGLEIWVMAEIPSNVILAEEFAERFDGFSIGSNDLTQLVLGIDRDSEALAELFDERHEAVRRSIRELIRRAHDAGRPVGICGQAPSDHPDFARFLVECGIDSISLNPDSVVRVLREVAEVEAELGRSRDDGAGT